MNNTPIEIERKYIIEMPDTALLAENGDYSCSEILQVYLNTESRHVTHRVRSRKFSDKTVYTETKKIRIDSISAFEDEHEITEAEFCEKCKSIKTGSSPIRKMRHSFMYRGQCFEIDIYPEWKRTAIMETELKSKTDGTDVPSFIKIIKEVSGERAYSNASMSADFPPELLD